MEIRHVESYIISLYSSRKISAGRKRNNNKIWKENGL